MRAGHISGRSWPKILAVIAVSLLVAAAASLLPVYFEYRTKAESVEALQKMKHLHLAIQQMTLDNQTTGDSPIRWTCSGTTPLTLEQLTNALVEGGYASSDKFREQLVISKNRTLANDASVFAVTESDPADTVLLAAYEWKAVFEPDLIKAGRGRKFVIFRKGGDGVLFLPPKTNTNLTLIGSGGMHNYLPLK
jgi:type II secretory pathway pseudopilin PulG